MGQLCVESAGKMCQGREQVKSPITAKKKGNIIVDSCTVPALPFLPLPCHIQFTSDAPELTEQVFQGGLQSKVSFTGRKITPETLQIPLEDLQTPLCSCVRKQTKVVIQ